MNRSPGGISLYIRVLLTILVLLSIWYAVTVVLYIVTVQSSDSPETFPPVLSFIKKQLLNFSSTLVVGIIYVVLIEIPRERIKLRRWHLPLLFIVCLPGAIAINLLSTILRTYPDFNINQVDSFFILRSVANYPTLLVVIIGYGLTVLWYIAKVERDNSIIAESLASEARWQMLRYQVNPHFLFNSLNSIMALINRDKELARSVVNELSSYFRYTLSWNEVSIIPLSEEIRAVTHYLEIQKIRFEEKLNYRIDVDESLEGIRLPVFGLQTLVENAVKYGLKTHQGIVDITITGKRWKGYDVITVMNSGRLWHNDSSKGGEVNDSTSSGLTNLKGRLELMYHGQASFELFENQNMVCAEIRIFHSPEHEL